MPGREERGVDWTGSIAQARTEGMTLHTTDALVSRYGEPVRLV